MPKNKVKNENFINTQLINITKKSAKKWLKITLNEAK